MSFACVCVCVYAHTTVRIMDISDDGGQKNPSQCDFLTLVRRPQLMQLLETSVAESEPFSVLPLSLAQSGQNSWAPLALSSDFYKAFFIIKPVGMRSAPEPSLSLGRMMLSRCALYCRYSSTPLPNTLITFTGAVCSIHISTLYDPVWGPPYFSN